MKKIIETTSETIQSEIPATEPKKRGRRTKAQIEADKLAAEAAKPEVPIANPDAADSTTKPKKRSGWNTEMLAPKSNDLLQCLVHVEIELMRPALGMSPATEEIFREFIAKNAPEGKFIDDETDVYDVDEKEKAGTNIWPVGKFAIENGRPVDRKPVGDEPFVLCPFIWDYQIRGMFKDSCGMLSRAKNGNLSTQLKAFKKVIDGGIFVFGRRIPFIMPETYEDMEGNVYESYDENGRPQMKTIQRSLRISGPSGERTALASSQFVPEGTRCYATIGMTTKAYKPVVEEWLDYGTVRGIGQWRNSGIGIFRWRYVDENGNPFEED